MQIIPHVGVLAALHERSPHTLRRRLEGNNSGVKDDGLGGDVLADGGVSVEVVSSERSQLVADQMS